MKRTFLKSIFMGGAMLTTAFMFSCGSDDPDVIEKATLTTAITSAEELLSTTTEGTAEGQYVRGSQETLQIAIDAAKAVASDDTVDQAAVTNATAQLAAAVSVYGDNLVEAIDPTNLVGQWTFDEIGTGSLVKDYSGNGFDGTTNAGHAFWGAGTLALAADRYGTADKALQFDKGSNVEIPYNTALNPGVMSISLWAKADVNDPIVNNQYMVSMNRWGGYKFNFQDSPKAFFTATYDDPAVPVTNQCCYDRDNDSPLVTQGEWWHIVMTFGNGHEIYYLNGVMVKDWDNVPGTISTLATPVNLVFGQDLPTSLYETDDTSPYYVNWGGYYIGVMDEVRIYKSVLSASQVTSIYELEKP